MEIVFFFWSVDVPICLLFLQQSNLLFGHSRTICKIPKVLYWTYHLIENRHQNVRNIFVVISSYRLLRYFIVRDFWLSGSSSLELIFSDNCCITFSIVSLTDDNVDFLEIIHGFDSILTTKEFDDVNEVVATVFCIRFECFYFFNN